MKQYQDVVRTVLERGTLKENRTGIDALSCFNVNYEVDVAAGFPLLTTKAIAWKNIVVENLWFLSGERHIGLLRKHGCKFWEPWADAHGLVPSAYGNFWRNFPTVDEDGKATHVDQVQWVLDELKKNPMSRRLVISAWEPGNAHTSKLPPCHAMYVFNVQMDRARRPRLCLHLTQRSCDVALGLPYNIAGYALILSLFARFADLPVGTFAHTLVDAHIYTDKSDGTMAEYDHVPALREQITRQPRRLPRLRIAESIRTLDDIRHLLEADTETLMQSFVLEGYDPHPAITFKVAV